VRGKKEGQKCHVTDCPVLNVQTTCGEMREVIRATAFERFDFVKARAMWYSRSTEFFSRATGTS
jgi:hypothetical protein